MYHICLDLEMSELTAAEQGMIWLKNEVIQIGAVLLNEKFEFVSDFQIFVKPEYSHITEFIQNLTGISENDLKDALDFENSFEKYIDWIESKIANSDFVTYCWGAVDYIQLKDEILVKAKERDDFFSNLATFVDLQRTFGELLGTNISVGLEKAILFCHEKFNGKAHTALADAFNTAVILNKICLNKVFNPQFHFQQERKNEDKQKEKRLEQSFNSSFASFLSPELLSKFGIKKEEQELQENKRIAENSEDYSNYIPSKLSKREKKLQKLKEKELKKRQKFSPEIQRQISNHHPTLKYHIDPISWITFYVKMLYLNSTLTHSEEKK